MGWDEVQRRAFLAATVTGLGSVLADRLPTASAPPGEESLGSFATVLGRLRTLDAANGAASVIMPAHWLAGRLTRTLGNTPADHELHRPLASLTANAAELAGWTSYETGDCSEALRWYDRSIVAARDAHDPDFAAFAGEYRARVVWNGLGDLEAGLRSLDQISLDGVTGQIRAHVLGRRARALAVAGRERASLNTLDQAAATATDDGPPWADWSGSRAYDDVGRGHTLVALGRGAEAYALLKRSLRMERPRRSSGTRQRGLAQAAMQMGEPKQAVAHLVTAHRLLSATRSRQVSAVHAVARELQARYGDVRAVRELPDRLRTDTRYVVCRSSGDRLRIHLRTCRYAGRGGAQPWAVGERLDPAELASSPASAGYELCERCLELRLARY
jgi:tetratricopeptide (TPR) repeat protein